MAGLAAVHRLGWRCRASCSTAAALFHHRSVLWLIMLAFPLPFVRQHGRLDDG